MNKRSVANRRQFPLGLIISLFIGVSIVLAQGEIVPYRDITGKTSVFVFQRGSKSVSKQFATQGRARRTKQQRVESSRKVSTQYTRLAKVTPRRVRVDEVDPNDPRLKDIARMPREQASKLFAGVGEYYMDLDDYERAIDFFRESVQLDAQNGNAKTGLSEALALRGNQQLVKGVVQIAQKDFEEALQYNPRNSPAYFGLAEVFSEQGDDAKSVANYEKALEFDDELTEIYSPLGVLYYQQATAPENSARAAQFLAKADDLLSKAAAANPNDAQAQHFIGLIRLGQGNNTAALSAFNKAKSADPAYAEAFYYAGETNSRMGNNQEATVDFRKAIQLRDTYFEAWYGLGSALFEMDKYEEAIIAFERAKRLKNDNAEVVANLGDAYRQLGKYDLAASNYNLATVFFERQKGFDQNTAARDLTADIYARKGYTLAKDCEIRIAANRPCNNWDAAVQAIEKAAQLNDNSTLNYANLGWAYSNAGRADVAAGRTAQGRDRLIKARDYLQKAVDLSAKAESQSGPLLNLGMVFTDLGDFSAAIETLKKVVQLEPKWVFAINELGLAYMSNKNYKDAISQFKRAVDRDDKFAAAVYNLGHAQYKDGNVQEAKKAYKRLQSMGQTILATKLEMVTGGAVRG